MIDVDKLCMGCMKLKPSGTGSCPYCGFDSHKQSNELWQLPLRTILNGRYLTGKVLGEGGFGIVYLGYDLSMEIIVAIKEMFPNGMMTRDFLSNPQQTEVTLLKDSEVIRSLKEKFLLEVRSVARLQNLDGEGLVHVLNLFEENNTAYMVMEYLDGESLKDYLKREKRISWDETVSLLQPVMAGIRNIHKAHLIHRDISPDNIMLLKSGGAKLMDFGGIKNILEGIDQQHTIMITVKRGYSPMEQYQAEGRIGPWTDIYSFCATVYRALTGRKPSDPANVQAGEKQLSPSQLGSDIPAECEMLLMQGLELDYRKRPQSMDILIDTFCKQEKDEKESGYAIVPVRSQSISVREEPKKKKGFFTPLRAAAATAVGMAALLMVLLAGTHYMTVNKGRNSNSGPNSGGLAEKSDVSRKQTEMVSEETAEGGNVVILENEPVSDSSIDGSESPVQILVPSREESQSQNESLAQDPVIEVSERPRQREPEKPAEKETEKPTEKMTEKPTEKITEKPTEKATEKPTEKITEKPTEKATEQPTEKESQKPTEKETERPEETVIARESDSETQMSAQSNTREELERIEQELSATTPETNRETDPSPTLQNTAGDVVAQSVQTAPSAQNQPVDIVAQSAQQMPAAAGVQGTVPVQIVPQTPETADTRIQHADFFHDGRTVFQNDQILPGSADHELTQDELSQLTQKGLCYAKNEIYARHGRGFNSSELREYFEQQDWYKKEYDPSGESDSIIVGLMTPSEVKNIGLLSDAEKALGGGDEYPLDP